MRAFIGGECSWSGDDDKEGGEHAGLVVGIAVGGGGDTEGGAQAEIVTGTE